MDNIIVKWGSNEYEVDSGRTTERYHQLITHFLDSELFSVNPFDLSVEELNDLLDRRANNESGFSWIEGANNFYSRCRLEKIIHCNERYPWDHLYFQPWQNFPVISMNRFKRYGAILLDNKRTVLPVYKRYEVLGSLSDTSQLQYFSKNIGNDFIYCYRFSILDDFNKDRWCLRFAEDGYKREALLLTQFFSLQYLINHHYECFPMPYLCGSQGGIQDLNAMETLLNPVIEENNDKMLRMRDQIRESIITHNLRAEAI